MSRLTVNAYMKGIPPGNSNSEKPRLLKYFIEGVCKSGDDGKVIDNFHHYPSDVAILQGFVHPQSKHVPHLDLRRQVLENQKNKNKRTIIADANLFLYADPSNTRTYLRYSYDGVLVVLIVATLVLLRPYLWTVVVLREHCNKHMQPGYKIPYFKSSSRFQAASTFFLAP